MRNKVVKKLLMIAMAVTMISGTSLATVYANANPPAEETTTEVVQETSTETTEDTEKKEDTGRVSGESNNSAFLFFLHFGFLLCCWCSLRCGFWNDYR